MRYFKQAKIKSSRLCYFEIRTCLMIITAYTQRNLLVTNMTINGCYMLYVEDFNRHGN